MTYGPVGTIIDSFSTFWYLTQDSKYTHSENNLMLPLSSLWHLKGSFGLSNTDKPSREFSGELSTGLLLWTFHTYPVYSLWTKEMAWIESQIVDHSICHGASWLFEPTVFCQVLLNRLFSGIVTIILRSWCGFWGKKKKDNGLDLFCQNSYMRSVDNDELFQGLFTPEKILEGMDGLLKWPVLSLLKYRCSTYQETSLLEKWHTEECVCVCVFLEETCCFIFLNL